MAESQSLHFCISAGLPLYLKIHNIIFSFDYLLFYFFFTKSLLSEFITTP